MSREPFELEEGAWLFADAHYASYNTGFYDFFSALGENDLPPQIVLMGDIFDLLFGFSSHSIERNRKMVDLLQRISKETDVVYLEGNHDFGLRPIFAETMRVVSRREQPLMAMCQGVRIALHHGDVLQGSGYELYTALIRHRWIDRLLEAVDIRTGGAIITRLERYNKAKRPCYRIEDFEERVRRRMKRLRRRYVFDLWVEGHYHQDRSFSLDGVSYRNLPAFACDGGWMELKLMDDRIVFEKKEANGV